MCSRSREFTGGCSTNNGLIYRINTLKGRPPTIRRSVLNGATRIEATADLIRTFSALLTAAGKSATFSFARPGSPREASQNDESCLANTFDGRCESILSCPFQPSADIALAVPASAKRPGANQWAANSKL
jgi:hypothetical protein